MVKLEVVIGKMRISCEANELETLFKFSAVVGALPTKCGLCGSEEVYMNHRQAGESGEFEYHSIQCKNPECKASFPVHQRKKANGGGMYVSAKDRWEIYVPKSDNQASGGEQQAIQDADQSFNGTAF